MIIAVDFDGTVVEHCFPAIGKEKPFAFEVMKELQEAGHQLILWTYRDGEDLNAAVEFCRERGIEFFAVNHSRPDEDYNVYISRKIYADLYIDDRNIGGFPGWEKVREAVLGPKASPLEPLPCDCGQQTVKKSSKSPSLLFRIFSVLSFG